MPRIKKAGTNSKKKTLLSSQAATDRVQKLRGEYWEKVKNIAPENLVFLSGNGGFTRFNPTFRRYLDKFNSFKFGGIKP